MKGYGKECDVWSLGVIVYILLCGFPPFYAENDAQLYEKIKRGEFEFLRPYWDPVSEVSESFLSPSPPANRHPPPAAATTTNTTNATATNTTTSARIS